MDPLRTYSPYNIIHHVCRFGDNNPTGFAIHATNCSMDMAYLSERMLYLASLISSRQKWQPYEPTNKWMLAPDPNRPSEDDPADDEWFEAHFGPGNPSWMDLEYWLYKDWTRRATYLYEFFSENLMDFVYQGISATPDHELDKIEGAYNTVARLSLDHYMRDLWPQVYLENDAEIAKDEEERRVYLAEKRRKETAPQKPAIATVAKIDPIVANVEIERGIEPWTPTHFYEFGEESRQYTESTQRAKNSISKRLEKAKQHGGIRHDGVPNALLYMLSQRDIRLLKLIREGKSTSDAAREIGMYDSTAFVTVGKLRKYSKWLQCEEVVPAKVRMSK